jgi:thiamine-monophosphate kinase
MAGEFELIETYFKPLAGPAGLGLADDAACLTPNPGKNLVITKDMLVEGVHFRTDDAPSSVARKALGVNLSDLAAKGATPLCYFLGLSLPKVRDNAWVAAFARGLQQMQQEYGLVLAGGDTTANPAQIAISITALGEVPAAMMIRRDGATVGDTVFVTGTLGDAALGLQCLEGRLAPDTHLIDRYLHPRPRVAFGERLVGRASACADVSDGLLADLGHICKASGCGARLEESRLPLSEAAATVVEADASRRPAVYSGGDDYELVFTAPSAAVPEIEAAARENGVPLAQIGTIEATPGVRLVDPAGKLVQTAATGFDHFSKG